MHLFKDAERVDITLQEDLALFSFLPPHHCEELSKGMDYYREPNLGHAFAKSEGGMCSSHKPEAYLALWLSQCSLYKHFLKS